MSTAWAAAFYKDHVRSIGDEHRDVIARFDLDAHAAEQLDHAARTLSTMPRWMASSISATRKVAPWQVDAFRQLAAQLARRYRLYAVVEEDELCDACFFRRDE